MQKKGWYIYIACTKKLQVSLLFHCSIKMLILTLLCLVCTVFASVSYPKVPLSIKIPHLVTISWDSKEIKKGNFVSFWAVLILWSNGHIDCHVWRWVTVPLDLAQSFCTICAHYHYHVIHPAITFMCELFTLMWERQLMLYKIA